MNKIESMNKLGLFVMMFVFFILIIFFIVFLVIAMLFVASGQTGGETFLTIPIYLFLCSYRQYQQVHHSSQEL